MRSEEWTFIVAYFYLSLFMSASEIVIPYVYIHICIVYRITCSYVLCYLVV